MSVTNGSYKTKTEKTTALLAERTKEALAWKSLASSRLDDIKELTTNLKELEETLMKAPCFNYLECHLTSQVYPLSASTSVRESVSSVSEFCGSLIRTFVEMNAVIMEGSVALDTALGDLTAHIGMPDLSELATTEGLSLGDMGEGLVENPSDVSSDEDEDDDDDEDGKGKLPPSPPASPPRVTPGSKAGMRKSPATKN